MNTLNDQQPDNAKRGASSRDVVSAGVAYRRALVDGVIALPAALTQQAFELRVHNRYASHPVEATLRYFCAEAEATGAQSDCGYDFQSAENLYRTGAQGLRLSEIPELPDNLQQLSRLSVPDRAGRKALRQWVEANGPIFDDSVFETRWQAQGRRGGAEHHVYHDQEQGRWFKRLYHGVNHSTLGDYLGRLRLHAVLFPETAYRLEGFTVQPKSKELAPVVSQPHVEVDTARPPVAKNETDDMMATIGFAPVRLYHNGVRDDGYFAYLHPVTGVLAYDLHDENVVRVAGEEGLAVIDPYIALARRGSWAAIKLAEIDLPPPADDTPL